jgi:hypothetical protein
MVEAIKRAVRIKSVRRNLINRKVRKMKTSQMNKLARMTGLAVGMALLATMAGEIKADGLIFKGGAQKLMNPPVATVIPSDAKLMACPKCTTELVERSIVATKATAPKTQLVARHLCNACETTIAVEGHGKAKHDVATHKCTSCGAETLACCSTKTGNATATKGMKKQ